MIPDAPTVLGGLARVLLTDLAAEVTSPYGNLTIQLGAGLLAMIAQDTERAAARLVEENDAIVALFRAGDGVVQDAALREALRAASGATATSLLLSDLRDRNRELRRLLTCLHAHVEDLDGVRALSLAEQIWSELVASTRRRQLDLAIG